MKADVSARHDLQVPRYPSYPTAPHFDRTADAAPGAFAAAFDAYLNEGRTRHSRAV